MLQLLLGLLLAIMGTPAQAYGRVETGLGVSSGFQLPFVSLETVQIRVVRANNEALISQRLPGISTNYYGWDGHGSTRFLLNPAGGITDTCAYDAYGLEVAGTGTTLNNYRYCGQQWDGDLGMYYLRARYYKPDTGRFWTMDSYEGNSQDPQSLHKYLYCHGNPVNGIDPSGHMENAISFSFSAAISGVVDTLSAVAVHTARMSAMAKLNAIAMVTATAVDGYLAYDVAQTQVKEWVEKGKNVFRQRFPNEVVPHIVPIPEPLMPAVAEHIRIHQAADPSSMFLQRAGIGVNIKNRAKVLKKSWALTALTGMSWDEYPFASSKEGGNDNVSLWPVPLTENALQGGVIAGSYALEGINPGDEFAVVIVF